MCFNGQEIFLASDGRKQMTIQRLAKIDYSSRPLYPRPLAYAVSGTCLDRGLVVGCLVVLGIVELRGKQDGKQAVCGLAEVARQPPGIPE